MAKIYRFVREKPGVKVDDIIADSIVSELDKEGFSDKLCKQ